MVLLLIQRQNSLYFPKVWDTVRSVRCLWEGSIKQTLSAGLNVETLNQDVLTFSGDMVAARLEIQVNNISVALYLYFS